MSAIPDDENTNNTTGLSGTLPAKKPVKKKYDIVDTFIKGNHLDAKDTVNNWCVAQIIDVSKDDSMIKLRFDGWSSKWDEVMTRSPDFLSDIADFKSDAFFSCSGTNSHLHELPHSESFRKGTRDRPGLQSASGTTQRKRSRR